MPLYSLNFKVPDALQNHLFLKSLSVNIVIGLHIHICVYLYATSSIWLVMNINEDIFEEETEFQVAGLVFFLTCSCPIYLSIYLSSLLAISLNFKYYDSFSSETVASRQEFVV